MIYRPTCCTDQVGEIGDTWQALVDDELEGDGGQDERERQLETVLRQRRLHGERHERQTADEELKPKYMKNIFLDEAYE